MSESCENFQPHLWKPFLCRDCNKTKDDHSNSNVQLSTTNPIADRKNEGILLDSPRQDIVASVERIPCKHGIKCYRTNPTHFEHYSHPLGHIPKAPDTTSLEKTREELEFIELVEKRIKEVIAISDMKDKEIEKLRQDHMKLVRYYQSLEQALVEEVDHREKRDRMQRHILAIPRQIPSYWGSNALSEPYREVQLSDKSPEFHIIKDLINSTISTHGNKYGTVNGNDPTEFLVKNVKRVHNMKLWHEYCYKKDTIIAKNNNRIQETGGSVYLEKCPPLTPLLDKQANEYWLFHGCSHYTLKTLLHDGYDPRVSNLRGMFGGGFYLAESSSKSNQYIPCPGCDKNAISTDIGCNCTNQENLVFSMVLYRVVLGDVHIAHTYSKEKYRNGNGKIKGVRRPPSKTGCEQLYDSVMGENVKNGGNLLQHREFILYECGQAYPEYVIEYNRSARDAPARIDLKSLRNRCENFLRNTFKIVPE